MTERAKLRLRFLRILVILDKALEASAGTLDAARLQRWQKLAREDQFNSASAAELRARAKKFGKLTRDAGKHKKRWGEVEE